MRKILLLSLAFVILCSNNILADINVTGLKAYYSFDELNTSQISSSLISTGNNSAVVSNVAYIYSSAIYPSYNISSNGALYSRTFTGTLGNQITVGNDITLQGWSAVTVTMWYKSTYTGAPAQFLWAAESGVNIGPGNCLAASNGYCCYLRNTVGTQTMISNYSMGLGDNNWHFLAWTWYSGGRGKFYHNGVYYTDGDTNVTGVLNTSSTSEFWLGRRKGDNYPLNGTLDEVSIWNRSLSADEILHLYRVGLPNVITSIVSVINNTVNLTSDGGQICGFNGLTYIPCTSTEDGTPTFKFSTIGNTSCKIANESSSWTTLDNKGVSDCATTGGMNHICTLADPLTNGTTTLYFSCKSGLLEIYDFNVYSANKVNITVLPQISSSQIHANDAIELGITSSAIWPGALIYTSQPVYIRIKNNTQSFATFDKVAVFGNQRWAFNYRINGEQSIGAFYNITPVFYYWEGGNLSFKQVTSRVSTLINSTKN